MEGRSNLDLLAGRDRLRGDYPRATAADQFRLRLLDEEFAAAVAAADDDFEVHRVALVDPLLAQLTTDHDAVAPEPLRLVECLIRKTDELDGVGPVRRQRRDAEADRHLADTR